MASPESTSCLRRRIRRLARALESVAESVKDGFDVFEQTLEAQFQSVSGVNLDEEAIDMIMLQRTYQASARYISTLSELMDILVAL